MPNTMKKLLQFLMTMYLSVAMVGCYSTEEPVGPDVPIVGALKLSQEEMTIGADGGEFSVDIFTEYAYETSTNVDWMTISGGSCGTEYCTLYFTVAKNNTTSEREGVITVFCDNYNLSATLTVSQEAGENTGDTIPNNEIWYTSTDGAVVEPRNREAFGANIVSNTYENGKGIIKFDGDVTSIGEYAFNELASLTSITIPDSVTSVWESVFWRCEKLEAFYGKFASSDNRCLIVGNTLVAYANASGAIFSIPDSVISIGGWAFDSCFSLTGVTIPDSVTKIGDGAFTDCTSLTSISIPDSVTSIGEYAFCWCSSLTSISIPDSVTKIGGYVCTACESLMAIYGKYASSDNRCLIVDGVLNSFAPKGLTKYTIPNSVTKIGDGAFTDCIALTSISIPDSVTLIGEWAFCDCDSLTSIAIPNSVTSIGEWAFCDCFSLTSVIIGNSVTTIGRNAFSDCTSLTSVTIGNSVTSIGEWAFSYCTSLKSVTIPDSVTLIGEYAFTNCTSLKSVTIGDRVTSIDSHAFSYCESLTSVTIGNGVTTIGEAAFEYCTSLTSVTIPDSVTSIYWAFYGCTSLKEVYCKPTTPPTGNSCMFDNNALERKIYVPRNSVEAYKSAQCWSEYADYIVGYDF